MQVRDRQSNMLQVKGIMGNIAKGNIEANGMHKESYGTIKNKFGTFKVPAGLAPLWQR